MRYLFRQGSIVAVAVLVIAGCSSGDPSPADPTSSMKSSGDDPTKETTEEASEPDPVEKTVEYEGAMVQASVGPIVVDDDVGILTLKFEADGPVDIGLALTDPYVVGPYEPTMVQVVDFEARTVSDVAWSDEDGLASETTDTTGSIDSADEPLIYQVAYPAPEADSLTILMPPFGVFTDVPAVSRDEAPQAPELDEVTDVDAADLTMPQSSLETFVEELGGDLNTRDDEDGTEIAVDSDVLFDSDSADVAPDADDSLDRVVDQLDESEGGDLDIIGHTDDVSSHEYNQDLSERRADAVAEELEDRTDLSGFDVETEGRSYDDPAVEGTSDEARAANRRVEVVFTADEAAEPESDASSPDEEELPDTDGPQARGEDGVDVPQSAIDDDAEFNITLPEVMREGDYLVGEFEVTNTGDEEVSLVSVLAAGPSDVRGDFNPTLQMAANKPTLLEGDTRYYTLDYEAPERNYAAGSDSRKPLADRTVQDIEPGETRIVSAVWPDTGGETVTVDSPEVHVDDSSDTEVGGPAFRLTDVPVVDAGE